MSDKRIESLEARIAAQDTEINTLKRQMRNLQDMLVDCVNDLSDRSEQAMAISQAAILREACNFKTDDMMEC